MKKGVGANNYIYLLMRLNTKSILNLYSKYTILALSRLWGKTGPDAGNLQFSTKTDSIISQF